MKMKKILFILVLSGLVVGVGLAGLAIWGWVRDFVTDKTYIVVLQNNKEIRPSGGFMGSYAKINAQCTMHNAQCGIKEFELQDIYVPDGQLVGHVDPPPPVNQAFGQGWWKLRDSNWDVDFNIAGEQIAWFFEQGGEKVDGIIAINLTFVNKILEILGEVRVQDFGERATAANLASLAQKYAEVGAFPGSTQKRDFLGAVGQGMINRIRKANPIELVRLARLTYGQLQKKQILVWAKDKEVEREIVKQGWGGDLGNYSGDYLYIVETNLGANKANCCVKREVEQEINNDREKLTIKWTNEGKYENPRPPEFWGGNYIDYVRVIIPMGSEVLRVKVAEKELTRVDKFSGEYGRQEDVYTTEERDGRFKIVGFWAVVPAQESVTVELEYKSGRVEERGYRILVKRQPGIESFPYKLVVDGKLVADHIVDRDVEVDNY